MVANMDVKEIISIGSLKEQDTIQSDNGLTATVTKERPGFYVVNIVNGSPFMQVHQQEVRFNHSSKRYEIDATRLKKWSRKD